MRAFIVGIGLALALATGAEAKVLRVHVAHHYAQRVVVPKIKEQAAQAGALPRSAHVAHCWNVTSKVVGCRVMFSGVLVDSGTSVRCLSTVSIRHARHGLRWTDDDDYCYAMGTQ